MKRRRKTILYSLHSFQDLAYSATSATATRMPCALTPSSTTTSLERREPPSPELTSLRIAPKTAPARSTSAGKSTRTVSRPSHPHLPPLPAVLQSPCDCECCFEEILCSDEYAAYLSPVRSSLFEADKLLTVEGCTLFLFFVLII